MNEQRKEVIVVGGVEVDPETLASLKNVEWVRRQDVLVHFSVGKDVLDRWVEEDKVEAHKLHPGKNGTVIFSVDDVRQAIRDSPRYYPSRDAK